MSTLERLSSPELAAFLADAAAAHGDGKALPAAPNGRMRQCARCERFRAQFERHDPAWSPSLCHSWVVGNRRFWSALCRPCGEVEKAERKARASAQTTSVPRADHRPEIGIPRPAPRPTTNPARPRLIQDWQNEEFDR